MKKKHEGAAAAASLLAGLPLPHFRAALGGLVDLSGSDTQAVLDLIYQRISAPGADRIALLDDWSAVGSDLYAALARVVSEDVEEEQGAPRASPPRIAKTG